MFVNIRCRIHSLYTKSSARSTGSTHTVPEFVINIWCSKSQQESSPLGLRDLLRSVDRKPRTTTRRGPKAITLNPVPKCMSDLFRIPCQGHKRLTGLQRSSSSVPGASPGCNGCSQKCDIEDEHLDTRIDREHVNAFRMAFARVCRDTSVGKGTFGLNHDPNAPLSPDND